VPSRHSYSLTVARRGVGETLGSDVYQRLRRAVLDGKLRPGQRLKPVELRAEFGASVGVVREALTRLAEQRLVVSSHNQGFRVVSLSRQELVDLTEFRVTGEGLALRLATERGDLQWESEVLAAHYRLAHTPARSPDNPNLMTDEWSAAHRHFHRTLIGASAAPVMLDVCEQLSDSMELYRRWSAPVSRNRRNVAREHRQLMEATLARDVPAAQDALRIHYETTTRILLDSGLLINPTAADGAAEEAEAEADSAEAGH
jgi:DNA-binding GntR family transcriptional regulator